MHIPHGKPCGVLKLKFFSVLCEKKKMFLGRGISSIALMINFHREKKCKPPRSYQQMSWWNGSCRTHPSPRLDVGRRHLSSLHLNSCWAPAPAGILSAGSTPVCPCSIPGARMGGAERGLWPWIPAGCARAAGADAAPGKEEQHPCFFPQASPCCSASVSVFAGTTTAPSLMKEGMSRAAGKRGGSLLVAGTMIHPYHDWVGQILSRLGGPSLIRWRMWVQALTGLDCKLSLSSPVPCWAWCSHSVMFSPKPLLLCQRGKGSAVTGLGKGEGLSSSHEQWVPSLDVRGLNTMCIAGVARGYQM